MEIRVDLSMAGVQSRLRALPDKVTQAAEFALQRGAQEVARAARAKAPKAFSTLTNSIRADRVGPLHYQVATGVNYARSVEEGRRPGIQPGTANGLAEWVRQKTGLTGKALDSRTYLIARAIGRSGIKAQPYMAPARDEQEDRVRQLVRAAVLGAAAETAHG